MYVQIIDALWDCFFNDILNDYERMFENNEASSLSGIEIAGDSIKFNEGEILFADPDLKRHTFIILWYSQKRIRT